MHKLGIVHRDLKPENIFLHNRKDGQAANVGDLGAAVMLGLGKNCTGRVGSMGFTAPEVLDGSTYDSKCDVFSLGCVIYSLISGTTPFFQNDCSMEDYFAATCYKKVKFNDEAW